MKVMNIILQENEKPISINEIEVGYYFSPTYYTKIRLEGDRFCNGFPSWKITIHNGKTYFTEAYKINYI